jgi:hypothetical protein
MGLISIISLIIINGFIIKTSMGVLLRTTIEIILIIGFLLYFYCKNRKIKT